MAGVAATGDGTLDQFVAGGVEAVHPLVRAWYDEPTLTENVRAWLGDDLRRVGDLDAARSFQEHCPVDGATAADYATRVVPIDAGLDVVAGVRFRPSVRAFFVEVIAASRRLVDASETERVADRLAAEFTRIAPRWVRLYLADERLVPGSRLVGDVVVAARVEDLRRAPASGAVTLTRRRAADVHEDYSCMYAEFHAAAPVNAALARVEDLETLEGWEQDGGLFEVRVDGARAGYCGAKRSSRYGVRGWCAAEIILARELCGRGLAVQVHRRVAASIDAAPGDALWADVHEDNAPSLRAGLRAGYAVIGRGLRVPL